MNQLSLFNPQSGRHNNQFLFSDYYLDELLPRIEAWERAKLPALQFGQWLLAHYQQEKKQLADYSEAQLEAHWFEPIFKQLGWAEAYETQAIIPALTSANIRKPDFVFFPSAAARQAAVALQNSPAYTRQAVAVGEVKKWDIPLHKKSQGGQSSFDNSNPMFQLDTYLRSTQLKWGILSNGRLWRLVNRENSSRLVEYFEIDLIHALEQNQQNTLIYFYLFFAHPSFTPNQQGQIFVQTALDASLQYARELEEDLRENAYKALEQLINGFFAPAQNQLNPQNPADLEAVYNNSLYLLYRLLFLFYGESRGLFPLNHKKYYNLSLTHLVDYVAEGNDVIELPPMTTLISYYLKNLFQVINGNNVALNQEVKVPRYNGGLFNPDLHQFLEKHDVGDAFLIRAIDYLARRDQHKQGDYAVKEKVDYRTLGIRQLGSIYEGLLEYQVQNAAEPMVTIRQEGREKWVPAAKQGRAMALERREVGELYLATNNQERRASGSYYTPDYIVKYIVSQTLEPLIAEAQERVQHLPPAEQPTQFAEAILSLKILDPAMGSGHFLVEATHHLAHVLANYAGLIDDILFWQRQVVERCIYGVDKNPLAVELAKVSLWLATIAAEKPLSFLDHHLQHGDALIGAKIADLMALPTTQKNTPANQPLLFDEAVFTQDMFKVVGGMEAIQKLLSETVEDIHTKEEIYKKLRHHLAHWEKLAHVWVSSFFGLEITPAEYQELVRLIQGQPTTLRPEQLEPFFSHPLIQQNDFFHWELRFPELFFATNGQFLGEAAGFDAIVGNPPWLMAGYYLQDNNFLMKRFSTATGKFDLYYLFIELATKFLKKNRFAGVIVPNKFFHTKAAIALRQLITNQKIITHIFDFGDIQLFAEATNYSCILLMQEGNPKEFISYRLLKEDLAVIDSYDIKWETFDNEVWKFVENDIQEIFAKLWVDSNPLEVLTKRFGTGVQSGADTIFILSSQEMDKLGIEKKLRQKILKGRDLHRYRTSLQKDTLEIIFPYIVKNNQYVLLTEEELKKFPKTYSYLQRHKQTLAKRVWFGKSAQDLSGNWYGLMYVDKYTNFQLAHLLTPSLSNQSNFTLGSKMLFVTGTAGVTSVIPQEDDSDNLYYLLTILNSKLISRYIVSGSPIFSGGYHKFSANYLKNIPVKLGNHPVQNEIIQKMDELFGQNEFPQISIALKPGITFTTVLSWLAQQMLILNQEQQKHLQHFWENLEGVTDKTTFAKLQKGKWQETLYKEVEATRPFLHSSTGRQTITLDQTLAWNEESFKGMVKLLVGKVKNMGDLLEIYRQHHPAYFSLSQKIAQIDDLINQLVYHLYGLTEAEIALFESFPLTPPLADTPPPPL